MTRLVDHSHYVQGVSWDPLGEFVATQSSDRHMHVYSVRPDDAHGLRLAHAGKLSKLGHRPTTGWANVPLDPPPPPAHEIPAETFRRPAPRRSASHAPSDSDRSETSHAAASSATDAAAHAPAASGSAPTTPALLAVTSAAAMNPPAELPTKSRRSSVSNAGSPALLPRAARSPSPAAPLPAVRMPTSPRASPLSLPPSADLPALTTHVLYGDAAISPFFRRLTWSTDGQLLLTPAGIYEDPTVIVPTNGAAPAPAKPEKKAKKGKDDKPRPTVYVYTRQNVTSAPSMGLRGHSSGSIVIRFSPILYELRPGVKINGRLPPPRAGTTDEGSGSKKRKRTEPIELTPGTSRTVKLPSPDAPNPTGAGPAVPVDDGATAMEPTSTGEAGEQAPVEGTASVIDLPHRMIYAVATHETVYIYDTQQTEQICTFGNLHYAPFTDVSWCVGSLRDGRADDAGPPTATVYACRARTVTARSSRSMRASSALRCRPSVRSASPSSPSRNPRRRQCRAHRPRPRRRRPRLSPRPRPRLPSTWTPSPAARRRLASRRRRSAVSRSRSRARSTPDPFGPPSIYTISALYSVPPCCIAVRCLELGPEMAVIGSDSSFGLATWRPSA